MELFAKIVNAFHKQSPELFYKKGVFKNSRNIKPSNQSFNWFSEQAILLSKLFKSAKNTESNSSVCKVKYAAVITQQKRAEVTIKQTLWKSLYIEIWQI